MEPTIYKPSIYKGAGIYNAGGGGGSENPDGSKKVSAIVNIDVSNIFSVPISYSNKCNIEAVIRHYFTGNYGFFSLMNTGYEGAILGLNRAYLDCNDGNLSQGTSFSDVIEKINKYVITTTPENKIKVETFVDGVSIGSAQTSSAVSSLSIQSIRFFKGRKSYNSGKIEIFGIKLKDNSDNVVYNFTPAIKEGVCGFYEEVNGVFYEDPYKNGTIFALEAL